MNTPANPLQVIARLLHAHMQVKYPEFKYSASLEAAAACFEKPNYRAALAAMSGHPPVVSDAAEWKERALRAEGMLHDCGIAMSPSQVAQAQPRVVDGAEEGGRYIYGPWEHLFDIEKASTVRFLFDTVKMKLLRAVDATDPYNIVPLTGRQERDLYDSLVNANEEALDCPEGFGLFAGNQFPSEKFWTNSFAAVGK